VWLDLTDFCEDSMTNQFESVKVSSAVFEVYPTMTGSCDSLTLRMR